MRKVSILLCSLLSLLFTNIALSQDIVLSGNVIERGTSDPLIGASVLLVESDQFAVARLDGTFAIKNIKPGDYTLKIFQLGFEDFEQKISLTENKNQTYELVPEVFLMDGVQVIAYKNNESEASARSTEKYAPSVKNVVSAKTIEISPDITVANVVQRVSGLTVERNSNGDGQHAIVRGMDKRYNYTLVNGIKIPSPDNENRYIPLDIFPAELLSRLVVSKALTPDMEGDAIGGVVDMKMKDAPSKRTVNASLATGYNQLFFDRAYDSFDASAVPRKSPRDEFGRIILAEDLEYDHLNYEKVQPLPNFFASLSWGNRFLDNKLGVIVAASHQNSFRGSDRTEFAVSNNNRSQLLPAITAVQDRRYSTQQIRSGIHSKLDYRLNPKNKISLYNVYLRLQNNETRFVLIDELRGGENPTLEQNMRSQLNIQQIYNSTLQGEHELNDLVKADWSLVYSYADQNIPDNSLVRLVGNFDNGEQRWIMEEGFQRIWENNSDQDLAGYYNLTYSPQLGSQTVEFKYGGLYRVKNRTNFYDSYTFKPNPGVQEYVVYETNLQDITWRTTNGFGTPTHVLNYDSYENIFANYAQFQFTRWKTQFLGGVRAEHTDQGYSTASDFFDDGNQNYWSILPSLHLKHMPNEKTNYRVSYFKSISRPSFLEIIPFRRPQNEEVFSLAGNPELTNVTAHNFDVRYEYYPSPTEQILIGGFYKNINDPIEYAVIPGEVAPNYTSRRALMPVNFEKAVNFGFELDYTKYIRNFGVRLNYTFISSTIESLKRTWGVVTEDNIDQISDLQIEVDNIGIGDSTFISVVQKRPLQGQSAHLGNLSLLYKNQKKGIDAQLALVYTGKRIAFVSVGLGNDYWQKAFTQLDFSFEKKMGDNWIIFCKINNLLNSPFEMVIEKPHLPGFLVNERQPNSTEETLVRRDFYSRSYMFGIRFSL